MFNELPRSLILLSIRTSALGAGLGALDRQATLSSHPAQYVSRVLCVCASVHFSGEKGLSFHRILSSRVSLKEYEQSIERFTKVSKDFKALGKKWHGWVSAAGPLSEERGNGHENVKCIEP